MTKHTGYSSLVIMMEVCAEGNRLIQVSAISVLLCQNKYISNVKEAVDMQQSLFSSKINTKMATITKSVVEMNYIVTIQKFICVTSSVNTETLKLQEAATASATSVRLLTTFDQLKAIYGCCHHPPTTVRL